MKKVVLSIAALALAGTMMAQDSGFNAGLDVVMPMGDLGDLFSVGFGPTVGYDKEAGDQGLLGVSLTYSIMSAKDDAVSKGNMLGIVGHYKYFFDDVREGAYIGALLGWNRVGYHYEYSVPGVIDYSGDESAGGLSFGATVGYVLNERIDLGLRYHIIRATEDGDATASSGEAATSLGMIGLRATYNF